MSALAFALAAGAAYLAGKSALKKIPAASSPTPSPSPVNPAARPSTYNVGAPTFTGNAAPQVRQPVAFTPAQANAAPQVKQPVRTVPHMTANEARDEALDLEWEDAGLHLPRHNSGDFANMAFLANMSKDILNMWPDGTTPEQMAGYKTGIPASNPSAVSTGRNDLQVVSTVGGLTLAAAGAVTAALGGAAAVSAAGGVGAALAGAGGVLAGATAAIPFIGLGIAGIVGIFTMIKNHHAGAVRLEQQIFYSLGPAAFNYLQVIRQSVLNGQASPSEAIQALDSLEKDFFQSAAPAVKHRPCNANCENVTLLRGIVIYWKSYYTDMILQGANQ